MTQIHAGCTEKQPLLHKDKCVAECKNHVIVDNTCYRNCFEYGKRTAKFPYFNNNGTCVASCASQKLLVDGGNCVSECQGKNKKISTEIIPNEQVCAFQFKGKKPKMEFNATGAEQWIHNQHQGRNKFIKIQVYDIKNADVCITKQNITNDCDATFHDKGEFNLRAEYDIFVRIMPREDQNGDFAQQLPTDPVITTLKTEFSPFSSSGLEYFLIAAISLLTIAIIAILSFFFVIKTNKKKVSKQNKIVVQSENLLIQQDK